MSIEGIRLDSIEYLLYCQRRQVHSRELDHSSPDDVKHDLW